MRPIKLTIKGLNSFKQQQTIDFEKLTSRGLFGIFGPTGSGKSSILDGITIALYGKNARGSTQFINTQCDEMSLMFEFAINSKHYKVYRSFKRNSNNNAETKKAKVVDASENEIVIAEGKTLVDQKCKEIIGLEFTDFIRTVVLPQGKFSEFLTLEGREKRDMLERIFALEQYGSILSEKLSRVIRRHSDQMENIKGALKNYESLSEESYNEQKELYIQKVKEREKLEHEMVELLEDFKEKEILWQLQEEYSKCLSEKRKLEALKETVEDYRTLVQKAESALKIYPYKETYYVTKKNIQLLEDKIVSYSKKLEELLNESQKILTQFEEIKNKKENLLPELKIKESKIKEVIEEEEKRKQLKQEIKQINLRITVLSDMQQTEEKKLEVLNGIIHEIVDNIGQIQEKYEALAINYEYKEKINLGAQYQKLFLETMVLRKRQEEEKIREESELKQLEEELTFFKDKLKKYDLSIKKDQEILNELEQTCPGDSGTLLDLQKKISNYELIWKQWQAYQDELSEINQCIAKQNEMIDTLKAKNADLASVCDSLEKEIKHMELSKAIDDIKKELTEGSPCPVCGSKMHDTINYEPFDTVILDNKRTALEDVKQSLMKAKEELLLAMERLKTAQEKRKIIENSLSNLPGYCEKTDIRILKQEFTDKQLEIDLWNDKKRQIVLHLENLRSEKNIIEVEVGRRESAKSEKAISLSKLSAALNETNIKLAGMEKSIDLLIQETDVGDFTQKYEEIKARDAERQTLEYKLKKLREELSKQESQKDELLVHLDKIKEELVSLKTVRDEKAKLEEEKNRHIKNKVGDVRDLLAYQKDILSLIALIEKNYNETEKAKNEIEYSIQNIKMELAGIQKQLEILRQKYKEEYKNFSILLEKEGFHSEEELASYKLSNEEISMLKASISDYDNKKQMLKAQEAQLLSKIGNRALTHKEWEEAKINKDKKLKELELLKEEVTKTDTLLKAQKVLLDKKHELIKQQDVLTHKISLLDDLEKLFKGKKFVEFVANYQLKFISAEASRRLREISGGSYGLELQENGRFIIRDYKNGGTMREPASLSGGETFLASLALALALSAHIQLKGTAPLEFFFLDEGFGTLDDQLLEVVMDSLERLHHSKLSVGIISHVEAIKSRVPVKLLVSPSQKGFEGSTVRLEYN